jgi:hypothetical protein
MVKERGLMFKFYAVPDDTPEPPVDPPDEIDWDAYELGKATWDELISDARRDDGE